MAIWIRNGYVIADPANPVGQDGWDILIQGQHIVAIGPDLAAQAAALAGEAVEVIEAGQAIVLPGLINAHMHSNESFEQGAYDNLPLELWLLESYPPFDAPKLSERDLYLRTMLCAVTSIRAGVTTIQDDVINIGGDAAAVDAACAAYRDAGLRAWVTTSMWDKGFIDSYPFLDQLVPAALQAELAKLPRPGAADQISLFQRHLAHWHGSADGRLRIIPAPCGPQRCTIELMQAVTELSAAHHLPVHTHVLETRAQAVTGQELYGKTLVAFLDEIGVLTDRFTLNHAIWLTEDDIARMGDKKCAITHNPLSNQKLGSGVAPVRQLLKAGVTVALGTDGTTTSDTADQIAALRSAALLHKIGDPDPAQWVTAQEAFAMATLGGAQSGLMADQVGSLAVGKQADLILLDRQDWGFIPLNDAVQQLAFSVGSEAVRTSIIAGQVVMRDRRLTLIDEMAIKAEVIEAAERFRRDWMPRMRTGAARMAPHIRAMLARCDATVLPHPTAAPVRLRHPGT